MEPTYKRIDMDKLDRNILKVIERDPGIQPVQILDLTKTLDPTTKLYKQKLDYRLRTLKESGMIKCEKERKNTRCYVVIKAPDLV